MAKILPKGQSNSSKISRAKPINEKLILEDPEEALRLALGLPKTYKKIESKDANDKTRNGKKLIKRKNAGNTRNK